MSQSIRHYSMLDGVRLRFALLIVIFVFTYYDTIMSYIKTWSGRNDYSHGFIVPLACLYFVYTMRGRLKIIDIEPNIILGAAVTLAGLLMLILGQTGGIITIQQLSLLVVLPGMVLMLLGMAMLRALILPLGYLVLMVPLILDLVFTPLHWPFQLFGAEIAAMILSALGIPVYHTAQYIELPNMPLEVANACSGIRYLVSITALAVPLAYLTLDTWGNRIFLVVSSLLIGILANPIRIAIIGLWVYNGGSILHGPGHILQGYFVSVVGFLFLFATAYMMSRKRKIRIARGQADIPWRAAGNPLTDSSMSENGVPIADVTIAESQTGLDMTWIPKKAWVCGISIMLAAGIFVHSYGPVPVPLKDNKGNFPLDLEGWRGSVMDSSTGGIVSLPGPDVEIRVAYGGPSNETIYLLAGYYEYQRQDKEFIHYTLQKLYDNAKTIRLEVAPGQHVSAMQVLIREAGRRRLVTYWYDMDGYVTSSNIKAKFITAFRGFTQWKTNGSIVLIESELNEFDSVENIAIQQNKFAAAIYLSLKDFLNTH